MTEVNKIRADLSGPQRTMLGTLYGKALDARAEHPILNDVYARDLVDRLDVDWEAAGITAKNSRSASLSVAVRGAHFDNWARDFLATHERAVVLHVGCGLDSRVFRVNPGPGVEWYDADYPDVIALRKQLYPERDHYHLVSSSITDPSWLLEIPPDRPVLFIAEGVTMYLTEADGVALLQRVVQHFPSGELQFDVFNWLAIKSQEGNQIVKRSGSTLHWAVDEPEDILRQLPELRLLAAESNPDANPITKVPLLFRRFGSKKKMLHALQTMDQFYRFEY